MIDRPLMQSRRAVLGAAALLAMLAAVVLTLALSRTSEADDVYSSLGERYSVLESNEAAGVYVVDPQGRGDAERAKIDSATPVNPVLLADGPVDTHRIRRTDARRPSRGVRGGSKVRGVWVAPSKFGGICVVMTVGDTVAAGGSCAHSGASMEPSTMFIFGNGTSGVASGETVIAGAVPDDVTGVFVELADGSVTTIPVVDNAFSFDTAVAIARYSYVTEDGTTEPQTVENPNA
jgi:hypothetical protein